MSSSSWTPTTDATRIPEVRHNIRLIAESCKSDLDGLAREAKSLDERKKWIANEDLRLRRKVEEEAECELYYPSCVPLLTNNTYYSNITDATSQFGRR